MLLAEAVGAVADDVYGALMRHPRSFLLSQVAPFLSQYPAAQHAVAEAGDLTRKQWENVYSRLLQLLQIQPRPDWPIERISVALQCIIDGVVVRHQVDSALVDNSVWHSASLLADTVIAFCMECSTSTEMRNPAGAASINSASPHCTPIVPRAHLAAHRHCLLPTGWMAGRELEG